MSLKLARECERFRVLWLPSENPLSFQEHTALKIASMYSRYAEAVDASVDPKKPALLQPKRLTSKIENDVIGTCPFCKENMDTLKLMTSEEDELDVYYCASDNYTAPFPNEPQ